MPHHILIIDDQQDIVRIIEREFQKTGRYVCVTALNSREAFEKLSQFPIDLIITDVRIGEENGFVLLKQIHAHYPQPGMMMMTAYRSPGYRQQAEELGVCFFIEKPFAVPTLLKAVERFFAQRQQAQVTMENQKKSPTATSALSHFKPHDLVQLFCLNGRHVCLHLSVPGYPEGLIYIQKGRVMHAVWDGQTGEEAFYKMLTLNNPELSLEDFTTAIPETIHASWECLLLESARRTDEMAENPNPAPAPSSPAPPLKKGNDPFQDFWKDVQLAPGTKLKVS